MSSNRYVFILSPFQQRLFEFYLIYLLYFFHLLYSLILFCSFSIVLKEIFLCLFPSSSLIAPLHLSSSSPDLIYALASFRL